MSVRVREEAKAVRVQGVEVMGALAVAVMILMRPARVPDRPRPAEREIPGWQLPENAQRKCTGRDDCWCAYHRWVRNGKRITPAPWWREVVIPAGD